MVKSLNQSQRFPTLFGELGHLFNHLNFDGHPSPTGFAPSMSVAETDAGYEVALDLPGVEPDAVEVELKEGYLWITGERLTKKDEKDKARKWHCHEQSFGKFRRAIGLAEDVDSENVEARYENGVLSILVPKVPETRPKRIQITR